MYCLSDQQIDFILDDIRRNGIEKEDLQLNLLDHICCIIEQELEENGDFEQFYFAAMKRFYHTSLSEIEEETHSLLIFKQYYFMKKLMLVSGGIAACSLTLGLILKFIHAPGASIAIVTGISLFSLLFLPLVVTLKVKEKTQLRDKLLLVLGTLSAISMALAVLFRLQYWPGANVLGILAVALLAFVFLPVYFITGIRQAGSKVNILVSSILLVTGCGLFLSLARSPRASYEMKQDLTRNYQRNERLLQLERVKLRHTEDLPGAGQDARRIDRLCEELKRALLRHETGQESPDGAGLLLGDDLNNIFVTDQAAAEALQELKREVSVYNTGLVQAGKAQYAIPADIPLLNGTGYRTLSSLNELVQVQMFVAQGGHN